MVQDVGLKRESCSGLRAATEIMQPSCCTDGETEGWDRKAQPSIYHQLKCSDGNSGELYPDVIPNFHCKSLPSRQRETNPQDSIVQKRESMYQSSREVRRIRKLCEGRMKVDSAYNGNAFLSFEIIDSSYQPSTSGPYLFSQQNRPSGAKSSVETAQTICRGSRDFLDLSFRELPDENSRLEQPRLDCNLLKDEVGEIFLEISLEEEITKGPCGNAAPHLVERGSGKGNIENCRQMFRVSPNRSNCGDRDLVSNLPKSVSSKVGIFDAAHPSGVCGISNNAKARSSPFKKMLDPIMKSKSIRSPSLMEKENTSFIGSPVGRKNGISRKSLLSDFSRTEQSPASNCQSDGEDQLVTSALSPTHLHAVLKLDSKNGTTGLDFCIEGPEDSISARTWKTGNELSWIYTFHSSGKRASASRRTSKDRHGYLPPIVGQMQASSYLCSKVGEDGILSNSAVTEFVLYDIAHARRSFAVEERSQCTDSIQPALCDVVNKSISGDSPDKNQLMEQQSNARSNSDVSTSCPWSEEDLHPHLEIVATVIEVPFNKARSKDLKVHSSPGTIKVVTPSRAHGLPSDDEASPSSLLDRWRYGGGCDCGGWDMACPIIVLDNAYTPYWADPVMEEIKQHMELFVQGSKEKLPALSMTVDGKGQFLVDFHAQLSALQAFSICISLLHCSEASSAMGIDKCKNKLYSSSLKLLEEEVRHLIEAVTAEENKKKPKKRKEKTPPVVLNPPFSPMGRV